MVEPDRVLVRWSNKRWRSSQYDQWINKIHYDLRIRPRKSSQRQMIQDENNEYDMIDELNCDYNANNENWKDKQVENWSNKDLKDWIQSLDIQPIDMKKIIHNINISECTGHDFNEMQNGQEIAQSFDMIDSVKLCNYIYISFIVIYS